MHRKLSLVLAFLVLIGMQQIQSQSFLKAKGTKIINEKGEDIILRGMGLGGWMLQEGYMLQINKVGMQHVIKANITDLIGKEECDRFYDLWLQNHVTKADVDSMAKWGFNSIRLPMHYNLYTLPIEEEPVQGENTWFKKGFELTDSLLAWCKANKLYLILDLHAAPGGQGKDANISDYDPAKPALWENDLNKQKTIALWRKLAERYSNEPAIGGYDLINEPNWTFEGKHKNGVEDQLNKPIWDLYAEITKAIREVDKTHMIIIEGNGWGNNYNGFPGVWDNNMVFSFHKYWNPNDQEALGGITALRDKYKVPVWLGESGENSDKWFTDCISLVEKNGIGWAWWPLKKIGSVICPLMVEVPQGYSTIVDYWNKDTERPSKEVASKALFEVVDNLKAQKCRYNKDIIDAMFRQVKDSTTKAFKPNTIPGILYAVDYDMGRSGIAYYDAESERTGEPGKDGGNKGRVYRNEGVDIEACNDSSKLTNGFNITSIKDAEWVKYTIQIKKKGIYKVFARVASDKSTGIVAFEIDNTKLKETFTIPASGGEHKWTTILLGNVKLEKGKHTVKLIVNKGDFKLNYLEFAL